jgi:uncharacterized protein YcbK (DUF882 family)
MRYFKEEEFKMGTEVVFDKMNPTIITYLDTLRQYVNRSFTITSSYRDKEYNESVGGSSRSQHLNGNAVDISVNGWSGVDRAELVKIALNLGLSVGIAKTFIHVDCRASEQVIWTY